MELKELLIRNLKSLSQVQTEFIKNLNNIDNFSSLIHEIKFSYKNGGRLYVAGNGGSAADAQHFVAELVCKFCKDRNPIPAEALTTDSSVITSIANDYSFDRVFERQLKAKLKPNDIFMGISTSGNSSNIINALKEAKKSGNKTILLTGGNGGEALNISDISIVIPSNITARIQEMHILFLHSLCEIIENELVFKIT